MTDDRAVRAATELMRLGVSNAGIVDLLAHHPIEVIEKQLRLLPGRKARRPEAFIIQAIRADYSAPNPHRHAKSETDPSRERDAVDQGPERPPRLPDAKPEGLRASRASRRSEGHDGVEPRGTHDPSDLPPADPAHGA